MRNEDCPFEIERHLDVIFTCSAAVFCTFSFLSSILCFSSSSRHLKLTLLFSSPLSLHNQQHSHFRNHLGELLICSAMGIAAIFLTAPIAAAAAAGLYFLDRHQTQSHSKVVGDGLHAPKMDLLAKMKKGTDDQAPKLAPQFDGLNCFETMVSH